MSLAITGKTAIVTGAASSLGLAIARHFIDRGALVVCSDIDEERLEAEFGDLARHDGPVRLFSADLCEKLSMANLLSTAIDGFGQVDILVNAARMFVPDDPLDPASDALMTMLRHNLMAGLKLSQMTARRMIQQAEREGREHGELGAIVNVSSVAARRAQPGILSYSIACAAQDQATRSLAVALAAHRIRVNGVAFASVMSGSLQGALKENEGWRDEIVAGTPLGRIAPPTELVETVQYLSSPAASFVTGQIVTVDGGRDLLDPVRVPAY